MTDVEISKTSPRGGTWGLLAEFADAQALRAAARGIRDAGYTRWDAHSPHAVHGLDEMMGTRPTGLPWIVLVFGLTGTALGLFLTWWTNASDLMVPTFVRGFPFITSGKPIFSLPTDIPVIFELTVLLASAAAFLGMLGLNRLPWLYNPLFKNHRFRRVTIDKFFISIEAEDPRFDRVQTERLLQSLGALAVEELED